MAISSVSFLGGLLLGVGSSLHCIGMCGGVTVLLGLNGGVDERRGAALRRQAALHGGRAFSYMAMGAIAGGSGSAALGGLDGTSGHMLMRWAAALALAWIGLGMARLIPSPATIGHALLPTMRMPGAVVRLPAPMRTAAYGIGWGFMPCGMVYGALLYALFAGSAWGGMAVMAGFALGTIPALAGARMGLGALRNLGAVGERSFGLLIAAVGVVSLIVTGPGFAHLCSQVGARMGF